MGASCQPVECLDSVSVLATIGAGRLVADLDWLDERTADYLDLPVDLT